MSDEDSLLQTILADPDDDTPRLVYADWLEENGRHERAEFIRVQVELQHLDDFDPRRKEKRLREQELLTAVAAQILGPELAGCPAAAEGVRRGFLEVLTVGVDDLPRLTGDLLARHPLRELWVRPTGGDPARVRALAAWPGLARLRGLRFLPAGFDEDGLNDAGLEVLLSSPHLTSLTLLGLEGQRLTNAAAGLLVRWPGLGRLTDLRLGRNRPTPGWPRGIDTPGVEELVESPRVANLKRLDLDGLEFGPDGAEALATSPHLAGLAALHLPRCGLGNPGVRALARAANLPGLVVLNLRSNRIGAGGAAALARAAGPGELRRLDLSGNRITDAGARVLARSPRLAGLKVVHLRHNRLGDAAAEALAGSPHLGGLVVLDLRGNAVGAAGARALAGSARLGALLSLDLRGNRLGGPDKPAVRALAAGRGVRL